MGGVLTTAWVARRCLRRRTRLPELSGRDVTFVWSNTRRTGTGRRCFLRGARREGGAFADFVFAIDTFVSSDSPLESKRFADARSAMVLWSGRWNNSNTAPTRICGSGGALAREHSIPVQYGVTGAGNDGSVFVRYGSWMWPWGGRCGTRIRREK